jgi:VanZ family protein
MVRTENLHLRKYWLCLGWLQVIAIIYLSLKPSPPSIMDFSHGDKVGHILSYTILMLWFSQLYLRYGQRIMMVLGFALMGITLEFLQGWEGTRMFEYNDMIANTTGLIGGWLLAQAGLTGFLPKLERRLYSST